MDYGSNWITAIQGYKMYNMIWSQGCSFLKFQPSFPWLYIRLLLSELPLPMHFQDGDWSSRSTMARCCCAWEAFSLGPSSGRCSSIQKWTPWSSLKANCLWDCIYIYKYLAFVPLLCKLCFRNEKQKAPYTCKAWVIGNCWYVSLPSYSLLMRWQNLAVVGCGWDCRIPTKNKIQQPYAICQISNYDSQRNL